jgi:hypothetical protein
MDSLTIFGPPGDDEEDTVVADLGSTNIPRTPQTSGSHRSGSGAHGALASGGGDQKVMICDP